MISSCETFIVKMIRSGQPFCKQTNWIILKKTFYKEKCMQCPYCGHQRFFIKDATDEFETYGFDCQSGDICFDPGIDDPSLTDLKDDTHIYCDQCAWNGKFKEIKHG
jgi:DNA-directed RNA polymerase subunit RPC12/RpoP